MLFTVTEISWLIFPVSMPLYLSRFTAQEVGKSGLADEEIIM